MARAFPRVMVPPPPDGLVEKREKAGFEFYNWEEWPYKPDDWADTQRYWEEGAAIASLFDEMPTDFVLKDVRFDLREESQRFDEDDKDVHLSIRPGMDSHNRNAIIGRGDNVVEAIEALHEKWATIEWCEEHWGWHGFHDASGAEGMVDHGNIVVPS